MPKGKSTWRVEFTHPVLIARWNEAGRPGKRPTTVRKTLSTTDRNEANALRDQFQRLIDDEGSWFDLPSDLDPRVERIWKGDWWSTHFDMKLRDDLSLPSSEHHHGRPLTRLYFQEGEHEIEITGRSHFIVKDFSERPDDAASVAIKEIKVNDALARLPLVSVEQVRQEDTDAMWFSDRDKIDAASTEIVALRSENRQLSRDLVLERARSASLEDKLKAANAMLRAIDRKLIAEESGATLDAALNSFLEGLIGKTSDKYLNRIKGILQPFVRKAISDSMRESISAFEVSESWVSEYIRNYQKRDGNPASMKFKKDLRTYIGRFLEHATKGRFDSRRIKLPTKNTAVNQREIVWLIREEADKLIEALGEQQGQYWQDIALMQRFMGWRTSELIWLRASGVDDNSVRFEAHHHPYTREHIGKTGSRRITTPTVLTEVVERRVQLAKQDLLFAVEGLVTKEQASWKSPYRCAWGQDRFQKRYRTLLRRAADGVGIEKPIDSRTLRRTFASQLLRDGRSVEDVATLLGDDPATVEKHYARILPDEVDPNLSFAG